MAMITTTSRLKDSLGGKVIRLRESVIDGFDTRNSIMTWSMSCSVCIQGDAGKIFM